LWVLRSIGRIGAQASNIAEQLLCGITGEDVRDQELGAQKDSALNPAASHEINDASLDYQPSNGEN
ncbi:hypothetical protein K4H00_22195, partial [Mycobacterium tuberculosis]|nr:hypothetical protein [Mycobacterium tuberculosis]